MPPNGSGNDMPGGGPLTPGMQGNASDSNLNAPKFTGNKLINNSLFNEDTYIQNIKVQIQIWNQCLIILNPIGGGPNTPNTPGSAHAGDFPAPSPKMMTDSSNPSGPGSNTGPGPNKKFPAQSPGPRTPNDPSGAGSRFPIPSPQSQQGMPGGPGGGGPRFPGPMSNADNPMGGNSSDSNMPLNPSGPPGSKSGPGPGGPPFDPISSLAQMSQQLQASSGGGPTGGPMNNSLGPGSDMNTLCNMDAGMMSMGRGGPHGPMLGPDGNPVSGPGGPMGNMDGMGPMGPGGPNNMGMMSGPRGNFGPMMGPNGPMGGPNGPMGMGGPGGPMGPGKLLLLVQILNLPLFDLLLAVFK